MIIALAGRRIDAPESEEKRFPLEMKEIIYVRIREFFHIYSVSVLVSSAACGADLLAHKAARDLGIEQHIILPFEREKFRETSVTDRPGDWGELFDEICDEAEREGNLIILEGFENTEAKAYRAVTAELFKHAESLQSEKEKVLAVAVWEGRAKHEKDETASFIEQAKARSIKVEEISTMEIEENRQKSEAENSNIPAVLSNIRTIVPPQHSENVEKARNILRGQNADLDEMIGLSDRLRAELRFSYARRILLRASKHENISKDKRLRLKLFQKLALSTYKDQDLPTDERLDRAFGILNEVEDLETTTNQETLGLLGAINKRKWEFDNQRQNLERSLYYYLRGCRQGVVSDQGYTCINAAFVLDTLASLEEGEARDASGSSKIAEERREQAQKIRQEIIEQVAPLTDDPNHEWVNSKWWYYATIAEAYFGLQEYDSAVEWLIKGQTAADEIYEWELETSARQLAALARLQDRKNLKTEEFANTPAWAALEKAFGDAAVPRTAFLGKIGLALSGGGFRASLYHLGVLARLAELGVLRYVEVLSCVSGGSIVGAHYYLKVRQLLQEKTEGEITREHYLTIVREMIDEFVEGVQKNVRVSVASNPFKILRMFWQRDFSRTKRAGELYERFLYSRVKDGGEDKERWLDELGISPLIGKKQDGIAIKDEGFSPKYQNWRRDAKVPILVLNAATLNTGHTWQFTTSWMGESPYGIDGEIDGNDRLRRMYYSDAPEGYKKIRLGEAVGASAAVPGVFEPITFDKLYPDYIVRLVDGGVCDNQGIASLLEQECKVFLVSDASGQMESEPAASGNIFRVLLRTNSVFQARIRTAQYHDLKGRKRSGLLNGLMFVHLKGDLEVDPVDWVDCPDPYQASDDSRPPARRGKQTRYGIDKKIQELLSGIRTDLDSFSEAEAYALMTSGYRMTEHQFKHDKCVEGFSAPSEAEDWKFLGIEKSMKTGGKGYDYLKTLLTAGGSIAFKVWQIDPRLKYLVRGVLLTAFLLIAALFYYRWDKPLPGVISGAGSSILNWLGAKIGSFAALLPTLTLNQIVFAVLALFSGVILLRILTSLVGDLLAQNIVRFVRWKSTLRHIAVTVFISTVGFIIANIHLYFFDNLFLRLGSMETLRRKSK
ncbi:MAG TPA: patatin-like phospholipase family protein [Pyrinomonadaceae bacterium]|nr:patatin-like phospholipase family protein [Pyrinomonadaceae bacterium]